MHTGDMMSTREVAQYLGIHEKQVYALIKVKRIPSTKITGKWVFPKKLIADWIESHARLGIEEAREKSQAAGGALLACGSNDPILDMLQSHMNKAFPEFLIFSANTGSTDGLKALNSRHTDLAWLQLLELDSGQYNIPFLPSHLPDVKAVAVNLFRRELGLILAPGNPLGIRGFDDLREKSVRFVNRQRGSGTRVLLDHHLKQRKVPPSSIRGYEREVYTHLEAGLAILSREADVGVATIAVAKLLGLPFVPVAVENFDMILSQGTFFHKGVQVFIEALNSRGFRKRVERIHAYDFRDSGKILYSAN